MLKTNILLYFLFTFPSLTFSQIRYFEIGDTLTVLTKSGLSLRDSNSILSKKLDVATFGQIVIVSGNELFSDRIDGRRGWWIKVSLNDKIGFMFSGYLSQIRIPESVLEKPQCPGCLRYQYLEEIVRLNIDSLSGKGERNWKGSGETDGRSAKWELFKDGTLIQYWGYYESKDLVVESYDITMYDILNLLEYYLDNLPDCCYKNPEHGPYKIDLEKDEFTSDILSIKCQKLWFSAKSIGDKIMIVSNLYDL